MTCSISMKVRAKNCKILVSCISAANGRILEWTTSGAYVYFEASFPEVSDMVEFEHKFDYLTKEVVETRPSFFKSVKNRFVGEIKHFFTV